MVNWLIEKDIFEENTDALIAACEKYGHKAHIIGYRPFDDKQVIPEFNMVEPVVFYGSLNLAHKILNDKENFIGFPGVYYRPKHYNCSTYYTYFGEHHVNGECAFMPWGEFVRRKGRLPFTDDDKSPVFVRPDSGSKLFTGTLIKDMKNFDREIAEITRYSPIEPTDMVVASRPNWIIDEYRLVVIGSEIITGSRYISDGRLSSSRIDSDFSAWKYAEKVLSEVKWRPEEIFVLDICRTMEGFSVMEIGCFSCCGLYDCDIDIIVKRVSEEATRYVVDITEDIPNKLDKVMEQDVEDIMEGIFDGAKKFTEQENGN